MLSLRVVVCFALLAVAATTDVEQCPGREEQDLSQRVQLSPCKSLPCKLKRGKDQHISVTFTPKKEISKLINSVNAYLLGLPVPFVGVDGLSVCDKIFAEDGTKVSCPLQAGTTYIYKDSFPVLPIYPTINTKVHWALKHNDKDVVCFEVPVAIK